LLNQPQASMSQQEKGVAYLLQSIELTEAYSLPPLRGWLPAPVAWVCLVLFRYWFKQGLTAELRHYYPLWQARVQDAEFHYLFGSSALLLGDFEAAKMAFVRCLQAGSASRFGLPFRDRLPLQGLS